MNTLTATYNEYGYEVLVVDGLGNFIEEYRAGNHSMESTQIVALDSIYAEPLEIIKAFAEQTAKDMAEEHNSIFCGIEYLKD